MQVARHADDHKIQRSDNLLMFDYSISQIMTLCLLRLSYWPHILLRILEHRISTCVKFLNFRNTASHILLWGTPDHRKLYLFTFNFSARSISELVVAMFTFNFSARSISELVVAMFTFNFSAGSISELQGGGNVYL